MGSGVFNEVLSHDCTVSLLSVNFLLIVILLLRPALFD